VVLPGRTAEVSGTPADAAVEAAVDGPDWMEVRTRCALAGVLVWSRSFHPAWRATVDGVPARTVVAEGHLLGVMVPAGDHEVRVAWSRQPLTAGVVLALLGAVAVVLLRRTKSGPRPGRPEERLDPDHA
jgi:hypothetical protein